jgi:hypothetical protein
MAAAPPARNAKDRLAGPLARRLPPPKHDSSRGRDHAAGQVIDLATFSQPKINRRRSQPRIGRTGVDVAIHQRNLHQQPT